MTAMTARRPTDARPDPAKATELRIDAALKSAYQKTLDEDIPSELKALLAKLKDQERS